MDRDLFKIDTQDSKFNAGVLSFSFVHIGFGMAMFSIVLKKDDYDLKNIDSIVLELLSRDGNVIDRTDITSVQLYKASDYSYGTDDDTITVIGTGNV